MSRGRQPKKRLSALQVKQALPGRYSDGRGLRLSVIDRGGLEFWRYWSQRIMVEGVRRDFGLGSVHDLSLAEVREIAERNHKIARRGGNPYPDRPPKGKSAPVTGSTAKQSPTFFEMYEVVTKNRRTNWDTKGTAANWTRIFEKHVLPAIGDKPVADITIQHIRDIVEPEWKGRGSKGVVMRQNVESVLAWAVGNGYRVDNPAVSLKPLLPKVRKMVKHHPSLPYRQAPAAMVDWQHLQIRKPVKLVGLLLILTAVRLSEGRVDDWRGGGRRRG